MLRLALFLSAAVLAGCAPISPQALRQEAGGRVEFVAQVSYQEAYRRAISQMRRCYQGGGVIVAPTVVQGDLYTDIQRGEISIAIMGIAGAMNTVVVDIDAAGDSSSKVTTYYWIATWAQVADAVRLWINERYLDCNPPLKAPEPGP